MNEIFPLEALTSSEKALAGNAKRSIEHLEEELLNQRIAAADAAVITNNGVRAIFAFSA